MGFSTVERRSVVSLSMLYAVRMLGLFMILPVLALYGEDFSDASPWLLGLALGAYGLTQAVLQLPLGMASDKMGRKPIILAGLLVFIVGSIVAALATSLWGVVIGRLLQGAGAIASTVMALLADLTHDKNRSKAMASIGASIGVAFAVSMVLGPLIASVGGLSLVFWSNVVLAVLGMVICLFWVPKPEVSQTHGEAVALKGLIKSCLQDRQLLGMTLGVFVLHFTVTALFLHFPGMLVSAGLSAEKHWMVYLPVMALAFVAMLPMIILAEAKGRIKPVYIFAITVLSISLIAFTQAHSVSMLVVLAWVYFVGFNLLEATLPSLVSKQARPGARGTAMGLFSSAQFIGAFCGGGLGGMISYWQGPNGVFVACVVLCGIWLAIAFGLRVPSKVDRLVIKLNTVDSATTASLSAIEGVKEVVVVPDQQLAYLKVEKNGLDGAALAKFERV